MAHKIGVTQQTPAAANLPGQLVRHNFFHISDQLSKKETIIHSKSRKRSNCYYKKIARAHQCYLLFRSLRKKKHQSKIHKK